MSVSDDSARMTFWDHLDALRAVLVKVVAVVVAFSIVAMNPLNSGWARLGRLLNSGWKSLLNS